MTTPMRLSELTSLIHDTLEKKFSSASFLIVAEISKITIKHEKEQVFIELVEKDPHSTFIRSRIQGSIWKSHYPTCDQFTIETGRVLSTGMEILMQVKVRYQSNYGLSLQITHIDPSYTIGQLSRQRETVKMKLLQVHSKHLEVIDGKLISYNQRLRLPVVIQRIAVITSEQADGKIDFLEELKLNQHQFQFCITYYYSQLQGENAAALIREKLIAIYQSQIPYDVVVIVRGGGASSDLLPFDQFVLCEAILKFPIPVFTGIGHTTNYSISDELAHRSYRSPTKVAQEIVQHNTNFVNGIQMQLSAVYDFAIYKMDRLNKNLNSTIQVIISNSDMKIQVKRNLLGGFLFSLQGTVSARNEKLQIKLAQVSSGISNRSLTSIETKKREVNGVITPMLRQVNAALRNEKKSLQEIQRFIESNNIKKWLKKGIAVIMHNGSIVTRTDQLQKGDQLEVVMQDGKLLTELKEIHQTYE